MPLVIVSDYYYGDESKEFNYFRIPRLQTQNQEVRMKYKRIVSLCLAIIGNADSFVYFGGNEQSTHKYISELLGKETIDHLSRLFREHSHSAAAQMVLSLPVQ